MMKRIIGIVLIINILVIGLFILTGCEEIEGELSNITNTSKHSSVTKENYDKIQKGMSEDEVKKILGDPDSTSESDTPGIGNMILKHYQAFLGTDAIDIYFLDGVVYMKNWTSL